MKTSIDHIIIAVSDLAEASAEYSALLGRQPSWRGAHPDYGTANTLFKLDNTYIELLAADGAAWQPISSTAFWMTAAPVWAVWCWH